ncbi:MAG: hypothetical protein QXN87_01615 [Candidatus Bathyarchaeia archaeon]
MQNLVEARIDVNQKITKGEKLPEEMILYAVDSEHFVIAARPLNNLEEKALLKMNVKVVSEKSTSS